MKDGDGRCGEKAQVGNTIHPNRAPWGPDNLKNYFIKAIFPLQWDKRKGQMKIAIPDEFTSPF